MASSTHGKICYLELPAADVAASAAFYRDCFGWDLRERDDGSTAFDDTTGAVSGTWVTGRSPSASPGMLLYVMVDDIDAAVRTVAAHGAQIVQEVGGDAPELTARFRDPGGNVLGLYEEPRTRPSTGGDMTVIQPELWVGNGPAALTFYESAFGARVLHRVGEGDDVVAQLAIDDAVFWLASTGSSTLRREPRALGAATSRMLLVVDDPETVHAKAILAGADSASPVQDEHGWRVGRLVDPFGHEWEIGKPPLNWPKHQPG